MAVKNDQSQSQSVNHRIIQATNKSEVKLPTDQRDNFNREPVSQPANGKQSACQPANQSVSQPVSQSTRHVTKKSGKQSGNRMITNENCLISEGTCLHLHKWK
jgi:hypothetical protein